MFAFVKLTLTKCLDFFLQYFVLLIHFFIKIVRTKKQNLLSSSSDLFDMWLSFIPIICYANTDSSSKSCSIVICGKCHLPVVANLALLRLSIMLLLLMLWAVDVQQHSPPQKILENPIVNLLYKWIFHFIYGYLVTLRIKMCIQKLDSYHWIGVYW